MEHDGVAIFHDVGAAICSALVVVLLKQKYAETSSIQDALSQYRSCEFDFTETCFEVFPETNIRQ